MKRIGIGKLVITAAAIIGANVAFGANGLGDPAVRAHKQIKKAKNPVAESVLPTKRNATSLYGKSAGIAWFDIKGSYAYNKAGVAKYGTAVIVDNNRIDQLKGDIKTAQKNNRKNEVMVLKRKLQKAQADLKRDKGHLRVDKTALRKDYQLTIADFRQELRSDKKSLCKANAELKQDKSDVKSQKMVLLKQNEVKSDKAAICNEKAKMKNDMAKVDKILK